MSGERFGLSCALATPFTNAGAIDFPRLAGHAARVLTEGCSGVTLFGTTGEGASIGLRERAEALAALAGAGIEPARRVVLTLAASSVPDIAEQAAIGADFGVRAFLFTPPYYFKGVSDDGLFDWYARSIERMGARVDEAILYNIPSVTGVLLSHALIGRLKEAFPGVVAGVKDSGGDFAYTSALLKAHPDLVILVGDERHLGAAMRLGASGAISGVANLEAGRMQRMIAEASDDAAISALVDAVVAEPVVPAIKALLAARLGDKAWAETRAPLEALPSTNAARLAARYAELFGRKTA